MIRIIERRKYAIVFNTLFNIIGHNPYLVVTFGGHFMKIISSNQQKEENQSKEEDNMGTQKHTTKT